MGWQCLQCGGGGVRWGVASRLCNLFGQPPDVRSSYCSLYCQRHDAATLVLMLKNTSLSWKCHALLANGRTSSWPLISIVRYSLTINAVLKAHIIDLKANTSCVPSHRKRTARCVSHYIIPSQCSFRVFQCLAEY